MPSISKQKEIYTRFKTKLASAENAEYKAESKVKSLRNQFDSILQIKSNARQGKKLAIFNFKELNRWDLWNKKIELVSDYPIRKMIMVINSINTGTTPPTSKKQYFEPAEVDFFTPADLGEDKFLTLSERKISMKAIEDKKARVFRKGTLLFVGIGSSVGKIGIVDKDFVCSNQQITGFTIDTEIALVEYVYYYFKLFKEVTILEKTQATIPIINQEKINDIPIPLPSIEIQEQVVLSIKEIENKLTTLYKESQFYRREAKKEFESAIFNID